MNALYLQLDGPFIVINGAEKRSVMAELLADNFCVQYLISNLFSHFHIPKALNLRAF